MNRIDVRAIVNGHPARYKSEVEWAIHSGASLFFESIETDGRKSEVTIFQDEIGEDVLHVIGTADRTDRKPWQATVTRKDGKVTIE